MNILNHVLITQIISVSLVYGQSLEYLPQRGQKVPQTQWGGSRIVQGQSQWPQSGQTAQRMAQMVPPGQRVAQAAQAIDGYMNLLQTFFEPKKFGSQSFGKDEDNCGEFEEMYHQFCRNNGQQQSESTVQKFCSEYRTRCNIILGNNFWHGLDGGIGRSEVQGGVKNIPFLPPALNDFSKSRATDTQFGITGFQRSQDNGFGNFWRRGNGVVANWMDGKFGVNKGWSIPILGIEGGKKNEVNLGGIVQPRKILNFVGNLVNGG